MFSKMLADKNTVVGFEEGRESLLQALAILRDEEEFKAKFGSVQDVLISRRETSVTSLCGLIVRLKGALERELEKKEKTVKLLEDIKGRWKTLQGRVQMVDRAGSLEARNQELETMAHELKRRNVELETRNEELEQKVQELEQKLAKVHVDKDSSSSDWNAPRKKPTHSSDVVVQPVNRNYKGNNGNGSKSNGGNDEGSADDLMSTFDFPSTFEFEQRNEESEHGHHHHVPNNNDYDDDDDYALLARDDNGMEVLQDDNPSQSQEIGEQYLPQNADDNVAFGTATSTLHISRSTRNSYGIMEGFTSQSSSLRADFSHPLLTTNPYNNFGSYYNPSQFLHRVSSSSSKPKKSKAKTKAICGTTINRGGKVTNSGVGRLSLSQLQRSRSRIIGKSKTKASQRQQPKLNTLVKRTQAKKSGKEPAMQIMHASDGEVDMDIGIILASSAVTNNSNSTSVVAGLEVEEVNNGMGRKESPDKGYFDYSSTYLEATENNFNDEDNLSLDA